MSNRKNQNELLTEWSKWLISINVFAATGCIIGLKTSGEAVAKTGMYFFAAIVSFGLSIVCATLFVFLLARHSGNNPVKQFQYIWLAKTQWILFTLGLLFVLAWIGIMSKVF